MIETDIVGQLRFSKGVFILFYMMLRKDRAELKKNIPTQNFNASSMVKGLFASLSWLYIAASGQNGCPQILVI